MRKKVILFIFSLALSFIFLDNTYANEIKYCQYKYNDDVLTVKIVNGKIQKGVSYTLDGENENADIRNLELAFEDPLPHKKDDINDFKFVASEYYDKNKECPKYALLSDSFTDSHIFLSDEDSVTFTEDGIEEYFSTATIYEFSLTDSEEQKQNQQEYEDSLTQSCMTFTTPEECKQGHLNGKKDAEIKFSCIWNINEFDKDGYCNVDKLVYVKCGDSYDIYDIPYEAPRIVSFVVYLLKIGTPIVLIFFSMIPLVKALASSNEDELKKAQKVLIKKLIAAALVFFVVSIVQFVIMKVADSSETKNISKCFDCFLNNNCEDSAYYKTNVGGTYLCKNFSGGDAYSCEGNQ